MAISCDSPVIDFTALHVIPNPASAGEEPVFFFSPSWFCHVTLVPIQSGKPKLEVNMACPFFSPIEPAENIALPYPARLPLGAAWRGACQSPGHELRVLSGWTSLHSDPRIQKLADCFVQSYLVRNAS